MEIGLKFKWEQKQVVDVLKLSVRSAKRDGEADGNHRIVMGENEKSEGKSYDGREQGPTGGSRASKRWSTRAQKGKQGP